MFDTNERTKLKEDISTMDEIFEIRDACKTPLELLNSKAFSQYLNIYKSICENI